MYTIILDDNKEYSIIKELKINGITYTLLSEVGEPTNICYRKIVTENNGDYYTRLNDEKEFDLVSMEFAKMMLEENK